MKKPINIFEEITIPVLLGIKAKNLAELRDNIKTVPDSCLYYHTHRFLKQHHHLIPEPPNDFAYWIRNSLNLKKFSERIASIDITSLTSLTELRKKLLEIIDVNHNEKIFYLNCLTGDEFHFTSCKTVCINTGFTANTPPELAKILENIDASAFYYHYFESKLRFGRERNDFSQWLLDLGETEAAEKIEKIDPYTMTIYKLRKQIINIINQYAGH